VVTTLALAQRVRAYARRRPEESVLYGVVQAELESFLADAQARERPVPRFVERELRVFLACRILAHGFVRVRCDTCGGEPGSPLHLRKRFGIVPVTQEAALSTVLEAGTRHAGRQSSDRGGGARAGSGSWGSRRIRGAITAIV